MNRPVPSINGTLPRRGHRRRGLASPRIRSIALSLCVGGVLQAQEFTQAHQDETERIAIGNNLAVTSCLELMPDGYTLLIGTTQDNPIQVMDTRTWSVTRTIDVDGYYAGPEVKASSLGKYLLLRQRYYIDFAVNKDRLVRHEVIDFATGRTVVRIENAHDAAITPDETTLCSLEGAHVTLRSLPDGKEVGRITVPLTRSSLAISPDGTRIAVSHRPRPEQLDEVPSMRNDKRGLKPALKYREMVSVFSLPEGKLIRTIPDVFDVIYDMTFTGAGNRLLIYSVPHTKFNSGMSGFRQGTVNMIDMTTLEPMRTGFMSLMSEPQLEPNLAGDRLALASTEGGNKRKLYVYDMATGEFTLDLDLDTRWVRDVKQKEFHDGTVPYHFLNDGRTLVLGSGAWLRKITTP